jgi:hypothetical protein
MPLGIGAPCAIPSLRNSQVVPNCVSPMTLHTVREHFRRKYHPQRRYGSADAKFASAELCACRGWFVRERRETRDRKQIHSPLQGVALREQCAHRLVRA